MLSQTRLKELLSYDPNTGTFRWRTARPVVKAGSVAGNILTVPHMLWVTHPGMHLSSDYNAAKAFPTPTDAIMHHTQSPIGQELK